MSQDTPAPADPANTLAAALADSARALGLDVNTHTFTPEGARALAAMEAAARRLWKAERGSDQMDAGQMIGCTAHAVRTALTRAMAQDGVTGMQAGEYVQMVCNIAAGFLTDAPDEIREAVVYNLSLAFTREGRRAQSLIARATSEGQA